jgi:signal transduction histidine kinase
VLHDDLQQVLYGLRLRLQEVIEDLDPDGRTAHAPGPDPAPDPAAASLRRADELATRALHITRSLTLDLTPPVLSQEGFDASLSWLAQSMRETHGLDVTVHVQGPLPLPEQHLHTLLFQLTRELLFNVVKHADVGEATVTVEVVRGEHTDRMLRVAVEDHGRGFDPATLAADGTGLASGGFGLFSVKERLALLGGHIELMSAPDTGTRALLVLPLDGPEPRSSPRA